MSITTPYHPNVRSCRVWLAWAVVVTVLVALAPGMAGASPARVGHQRSQPHSGLAPSRSGMSLSQAPAGLQAAVHRTLSGRAAAAGSSFQTGKLTAKDGVAGDDFGVSVAVSGSTAVVGAYTKNSDTGAAYVFVRSGKSWTRQAELTAKDATAGDQFGESVAIYGSTAVVGAYAKNSETGAAYVFVRSGRSWTQQAELTATDAAAGDGFGVSVAISGSTAVIGSPGNNSGTGAAYVFTRSGTTWSQQAELTASDGASDSLFGFSASIYGSTAVIGAYGNNSSAGAAYVFVNSGTTWSQQSELTASDAASGDDFGASVAIFASTVVVGAFAYDSSAGAAYVFVRSGTTWTQQSELTASDAASRDDFGASVAIYGSAVVIGAPSRNSDTGAAYVFVNSGTTWTQQAELTASDAASGDRFGASVALSGSTAVIGAPDESARKGAAYTFVLPSQQAELSATGGDYFGASVALLGSTAVIGAPANNSNAGAAYVYTRSGTRWTQQAELTASDAASSDFFGYSVALSGSTAVIGAPGKNSSTGAAYVYTRSGTAWSQEAELTASDAASGDFFGASVALSGSTAVIGAPNKNSNAGAAYVYTRSGTAWSQQAELTAPDAASGDYFGASVALSGSTAVVGADGLTNDDRGAAYVFVRSGTAWSQQSELTPSDNGVSFGASVALSGSTAVIGAPLDDPLGYSEAGAAYVFVDSGSTWTQQAELTASDAAVGDFFGSSVAVYGSTAVIGAPALFSTTGAAYVFVHAGGTWSQQAELTASDAAALDGFGVSVALYGSTAVIGADHNNSNTGAAYVFAHA